MKKLSLLFLATVFLMSSCKDKAEEEITIDLVGDWNVVSKNDGSIDADYYFNESNANEFHTVSDLLFDDACGTSNNYQYEKHLKEFYVSFGSNGIYTETKVYEQSDIDIDAVSQAPCGTDPIYTIEMITEITTSEWSLDGNKLMIESLMDESEIEEIDATELIISKGSVVGNQRVEDVYARR